jgi:serine O-acetyltransferase
MGDRPAMGGGPATPDGAAEGDGVAASMASHDHGSASPATWPGTFARLRQDARRLRRYQLGKFGYVPLTWFLDPGWTCVWLHRISHLLLARRWNRGARLLMQMNSLITGADIQPASDLGGGLLIPSPCGVNISAKAGENLAMLPLAGIGGSIRARW